ncbi:MAG: HNH endonuclease [Symbiobacteriia bacterium]
MADQQRLVLLPGPRSVAVGDELCLRNSSGEISWVADVLMVQSMGGAQAWEKQEEDMEQPYVVAGWLARVHPGTLPVGSAHLAAPWVTLNSRTLDRALPWREGGHLVYHHTLHLVESVLTDEEFEQAQTLGIVAEHRSGHWFFPMGDARKRFLVQVRQEPLVCALCGTAIPSLEECTQDHRIASSQGGPDVLGNLQLAHKICNEVKGNALPEQYPPVFLPPGTEETRYGTRRSHRRSPGQRAALPVPVLAPVAAAASGVAASLLTAAGRTAAALPSPSHQPVEIEAAASQSAETEAKAPSSGRRGAKSRKAASTKKTPAANSKATANADTASAAADAAADAAAVTEVAAPKTRTRKTRSAKAAGRTAARESAPAAAERAATAVAAVAEAAAAHASAIVTEATASTLAESQAGAALEGLSAPEEWLHKVQASSWQELAALATMPDWAARTATLRTMCALRRNQAQRAETDGMLVTEATGKEGRFGLLTWKDQQILVEEKGSRRHVHQVHMLQGLAPEVYVWWVSEFGRTAPLSVAMSLLALWQSGAPDAEGRVTAKKGPLKLTLKVSGDRLIDCRRTSSDTAVA